MPKSISPKFFKNHWGNDVFLSLFFGVLAVIFGMIKIKIPGIEGTESNFMEAPLLIYLLYLKHPIFVLFTCFFTLIPTLDQDAYLSTYSMHVVGLIVAWHAIKLMNNKLEDYSKKVLVWTIITIIYYVILLIPILITVNFLMGLNEWDFFNNYTTIIYYGKFEIISTILITGLYLLQHETRKKLEANKNSLEQTVKERTIELENANNHLITLNGELITNSDLVKLLNENLDDLVKKRSEKIEEQLKVLNKYANMNSHELHAPLARLMGLMNLIGRESNEKEKSVLLDKLNTCANELDSIIQNMNRLLEKEITSETILEQHKRG